MFCSADDNVAHDFHLTGFLVGSCVYLGLRLGRRR